jgi:hypothetical protein
MAQAAGGKGRGRILGGRESISQCLSVGHGDGIEAPDAVANFAADLQDNRCALTGIPFQFIGGMPTEPSAVARSDRQRRSLQTDNLPLIISSSISGRAVATTPISAVANAGEDGAE